MARRYIDPRFLGQPNPPRVTRDELLDILFEEYGFTDSNEDPCGEDGLPEGLPDDLLDDLPSGY